MVHSTVIWLSLWLMRAALHVLEAPLRPLKKRADPARSRDEQRAPRGFARRADVREWQGGVEHLCDYEIRRSGDRPKPDIGAGAEHRGSA